MPRDGRPARLRLRQAALDLYGEHGFDRVTTADIAKRAGVTERTFYRHFADKREVLFDEAPLRDAVVAGIADAPEALPPLPAVFWCFRTLAPMLAKNRPFSEPLQRVIAATPALRERARAKEAVLTEAMATALRDRGVPESTASLAARVGMAVFAHVSEVWFRDPAGDLDALLTGTFDELRALTSAR